MREAFIILAVLIYFLLLGISLLCLAKFIVLTVCESIEKNRGE